MIAASDIPAIDWTQTGILGVLVATVLWTGLKRKWIFYWVHEGIVRSMEQQIRDKTVEAAEWKRLALSQAGIVEQTVDKTQELIAKNAEELRHQALEEAVRILRREGGVGGT